MQCKNCKFFKRLRERGGHCLRYPPQLVFEKNQGAIGQATQYFPYMENDEWCGEHQPADRQLTPLST